MTQSLLEVRGVEEVPTQKVRVAFTEIGGESRRYLARLNPGGTIDSEFYPHFDGQVGTIVLLAAYLGWAIQILWR